MFFVALTKKGITWKSSTGIIEEFPVHSWKATVVTDRFLSEYFPEKNGFSIIESPLISTPDPHSAIFSKVTYDTTKDSLTIFKSTISGRPIYYHVTPNGEFFCSTHISLLRAAGVPIEENRDVLPEFFVFRFVIPPNTLYKNTYQLFSGDQLTIRLKNEKYRIFDIKQFIPLKPERTNDIDTLSKHALSFLNKSIHVLEPCHHRISTLLSGGLDSSILFKICQANFQTNTTFSTSFPFEDPKNDLEKEYSLSAASHFKTNHQYFEMTTKEYLRGFLEAILKAEVPVHHLQSVPLFLLSKHIPEKNNLVISGLGADDVFGTTTQYEIHQIETKFLHRLLAKYQDTRFLQYIIHQSKNLQRFSIDLQNYNRSRLPFTDSNNLLWSLGAYGSMEWASTYFHSSKEEIIKNRCNVVKKFSDRSIYDIISTLLFFGSASATQAIWAKLAESERKIFYYPYSHIDLLHLVFSIPWDIKLEQPKNILRYVARRVDIPEKIINRPKSGFGVHPKLWAERNGVFESLVPLAAKIIDEKEIRNMQSIDLKKSMTYWSMLNYAIWKRLCIHNEPLNVLLEEIQ
jgi:asparagine synthetase B (glutamine-hydrolysing)